MRGRLQLGFLVMRLLRSDMAAQAPAEHQQ